MYYVGVYSGVPLFWETTMLQKDNSLFRTLFVASGMDWNEELGGESLRKRPHLFDTARRCLFGELSKLWSLFGYRKP